MSLKTGAGEVRIIAHADDYGMTPEQSRRILECSSACGGTGALNSLSVLVGSPHAQECARMMAPHLGSVMVGLHLNLVEGPCCADPSRIPLLADAAGRFRRSFAGLLLESSRNPWEFRRQVAIEAAAQIDAFLRLYPQREGALRVDSHQHTHLIPGVLDGLLLALAESGCRLEYLRIPAEPSAPFLRSLRAFRSVAPVNWVKHLLLNALWAIDRVRAPGLEAAAGVFCGVNYSGRMTAANVGRVAGAFRGLAARSGRPLELLFHPGGVDAASECLDPQLAGFVAFYQSPLRAQEARALQEGSFLPEAPPPPR